MKFKSFYEKMAEFVKFLIKKISVLAFGVNSLLNSIKLFGTTIEQLSSSNIINVNSMNNKL